MRDAYTAPPRLSCAPIQPGKGGRNWVDDVIDNLFKYSGLTKNNVRLDSNAFIL